MKQDKTRVLIIGLILTVVILLGIILVVLVIKPAVNGYLTKTYQTGMKDVVFSIVSEAAQCKQIPLTFNDQTVTLVSMECLQQQFQQNSPNTS